MLVLNVFGLPLGLIPVYMLSDLLKWAVQWLTTGGWGKPLLNPNARCLKIHKLVFLDALRPMNLCILSLYSRFPWERRVGFCA